MNSLKVFSVIASLGIVATAAVGGVALVNNVSLNSQVNAGGISIINTGTYAGDHQIVLDKTVSGIPAYSATNSGSFVYEGFTFTYSGFGLDGDHLKLAYGKELSTPNDSGKGYVACSVDVYAFGGTAYGEVKFLDSGTGTNPSFSSTGVTTVSGLDSGFYTGVTVKGKSDAFTSFNSLTFIYKC